MLDDTAIFAAVVQQGGFSHAARFLNISNGLVSRRIAKLEEKLGVTLIKRTTRQIHLTPEGELFWQHAERIQKELESAVSLIQSLSEKPKGTIRISAPLFFGRTILTPILADFLKQFPGITIDLILTNLRLDPIKEGYDLMIRGAGYAIPTSLKDSNLIMKPLVTSGIGLYASPEYLLTHGEPASLEDLDAHIIIGYVDQKLQLEDFETWRYQDNKAEKTVTLKPKFNCNDMECGLTACVNGYGIGRFGEIMAKEAIRENKLRPVLTQYDWGSSVMYALYNQQKALPKRTRLLLDFIVANTKNLCVKVNCD